jgi:hypothetical protein
VAFHLEIGKEGHGEVSRRVERHAARQVTAGHAEEQRQQRAGNDEDEIPEPLPHEIVEMATHFQCDPPQNEAPEDKEEREVIAGKRGRH